MSLLSWDHPDTARYYEAFCERHGRYRDANAALAGAAAIGAEHRVLDLAAGTGRTADAAAKYSGDITCVEAARAMRDVGTARLPGVRWLAAWPAKGELFDRVLCGAAVWQMLPLAETFARVADLVAPGGAFVFNILSQYLGEADAPGGGRDPYLVELYAALADGRGTSAAAGAPLPGVDEIAEMLRGCGFEAYRWCVRFRLTQSALRDWMKIPPITDYLFDGMAAGDRAARVDAAFAGCDAESWRWEAWTGWTAWKR